MSMELLDAVPDPAVGPMAAPDAAVADDVGWELLPDATVAGVPLTVPPTAPVGIPIVDDRFDDGALPEAATGRRQATRSVLALLEGQRGIWFGAARSGDCVSLRHQLERGTVKVNARGDWGMTALHLATEHRHTEAVRLLLEAKADPSPNDRGLNNDTPLHFAAYHGSVEIVRMLLQGGAQADAVNANQRTPASLAGQEGGGRPLEKQQCLALITGWRTAVTGSPVLEGNVVSERSDYYYYEGPQSAWLSAGGAPAAA